MFRSISVLAVLPILAATAFAHEGHGHPSHQEGVTHYVVNPSHGLPILLAAIAAIGLGLLIRNRIGAWRAK